MSFKIRILRGSAVMTLGAGITYGASFLRNLLLARLLTKADYGVAATFGMFISMLEMSSKLAVAQFIVQARDGDDPDFQATAQFVQFLAGFASALLMSLAAWPLAMGFNLPQQQWAFQLLALVPLFKGLEHLDVRRKTRDLLFLPATAADAIPLVLTLLAVWPLAVWLKDFRAMLWLLLAYRLSACAASHLLAERPYRWRVEQALVVRILRFGWPLVLNSFLMFGVMQGDQFVVGMYYAKGDLAVYANAAALAVAPGEMFLNIMGSLLLPVLARVQEDRPAFHRNYRVAIQASAAFAAAFSTSLVVGAEVLAVMVFGAQYRGAGLILAFLSIATAFRLMRCATVAAAMARADSKNQLIANLLRSTSLIPTFLAAVSGQPLWVLAAVGLLGEGLAFVGSLLRLEKRDRIPLRWTLGPVGICAAAVLFAIWLVAFGVQSRRWFLVLPLAAGLGLVAGGIILASFPESRRLAQSCLRGVQARVASRMCSAVASI